mgnify:CR=1 FL=1
MSSDEWKEKLSSDVYHVTREKGTEAPFSGKLLKNNKTGLYTCSNCGSVLFDSSAKFDSGTGWPSFDRPAAEWYVKLEEDISGGTRRTEVTCAKCGAHLGHVFSDGPTKTGARFCINSLSLGFEEKTL